MQTVIWSEQVIIRKKYYFLTNLPIPPVLDRPLAEVDHLHDDRSDSFDTGPGSHHDD
jgi:hypothetical protein